MKSRMASILLGMTMVAGGGGCFLHPPYGEYNDNTTLVPPLGKFTHRNNLPPAQMLMEPGPGVGGPGPGIMAQAPTFSPVVSTSQVAFVNPEGMAVAWDVRQPGGFDSEPLIVPGRYNFPQGAIFRLKLTNIPGRAGVELYPTLEVGPPTPRTEAYLAHNAIPVQYTEEDFDQVLSGNFVTKVIYLPDPEFQELALAGVETLVSTRLDPGIDPIVEADRRGAILAVIRIGNKDLEVPGGEAELSGGHGGGPLPFAGGGIGYGPGGPGRGPGCGPGGACFPGTTGAMPAGSPPSFVAGVTAPEYGMPMSGTPIGLPGPPHVPLGIPAGLQKHVIVNHTKSHIPPPTRKFKIDVKQEPGFSYPKPVSRVHIEETTHVPPVIFRQPLGDTHEHAANVPDCVDCE
ncbi:MAG: hypothetical protein HY288_09145 [Planctomycetia bacterium]|nr:hypothetical protein [Planctomycetia bacterium]